MVLLLNLNVKAQTQSITVDTTITADCEFDPFNSADAIYSLSINGSLTLNSDTSLVRVVLYDTLFNEYMVYESYPLIASDLSFSFYDVCDETCYLDSLSPYTLEVQIIDATLNLSSLSFEPNFINSADSLQTIAKQTVELQKVTQMQSIIIQRKMLWLPDTNTVSKISYTDKKGLFGVKYNMQGLDYYSGGIYMSLAPNFKDNDNSTIVPEWDWRSRHGANDPTKTDYYYDINATGEGWMTIAKDQEIRENCGGLCYIYAPLGAMEGYTNIFLNRLNTPDFINFDLSEQHVLECDGYGGGGGLECIKGPVDGTNSFLKNYGVVDEDSYPHNYPDGQCDDPINSPDYRLEIERRSSATPPHIPELVIKTKLIEKGPLTATLPDYFTFGDHAMVLVGYGKVQVGDILYNGLVGEVVKEGDPFVGETYWKFKNSWHGANWGDNGYYYHLDDDITFGRISYLIGVVDDLTTPETEEPECFDKDNDGYFNWGIYDNTPNECEEDFENRDSDDSDPRLGPFDEDYYSTPVAPLMEVFDDANPEPNIIPNNTFYSFFDASLPQEITLAFNIVNNGNAQLNLYEPNIYSETETIEIGGDDANDFVLDDDDLELIIPKGGGSTSFEITLTAPINPPKIATVTIHVDEDDMEDYKFTLVFTDCLQTGTTETITGIETWDEDNGPHIKFGDVKVAPGAVLTIETDVAFVNGATLIIDRGGIPDQNYDIEPGGKVYVDGGLLTSLICSDNNTNTWKGVNVWGYKENGNDEPVSQFPDQEGDYAQGLIKLMNGGTISNAEVGIETIGYINDKAMAETSGGIVMIDEGSIINCNEGVVFYPYTNIHPFYPTSEPYPNLSHFALANFYNSRKFATKNQIKFTGVHGVEIKGCTFVNEYEPNPVVSPIGIKSEESGFIVKKYVPLPWEGDPVQTTFKNFDKAISASNNNSYGNIRIDSAYFEDNKRGIYLSQVNNPVIIKNEFNVRKRFSFFPVLDDEEAMVGLYINDDSEGFVIEENVFYSELRNTELQTTTCEGITLNNTGQKPNEVYNNSFNSLSAGIVAAGENRDGEGAGLCIKCNDFRDCLFDIWVVPEKDENGDPIIGPTIGIAEKQGLPSNGNGNPTLAASNTFSKRNDDLGVVNYENLVDWNDIEYTHHSTEEQPKKIKPLPYTVGDVIPIVDEDVDYSKELSCPSNYNGGGIDKAATTSTYSTELLSVSAYKDSLSTLVDGGDTEDLAWDVNMSTPPEAADVRQELLDESPYLSDTVMKAAIAKEDVLPNAMIRDVLVANPQSAKSIETLQALNQRNDTMPAYMLSQIMQGINTYGAKELLEQQLAGHKTKKGNAMTRLMHYYLVDTVNYCAAIDSMIHLLENDNELSSKYQLIMKYLGMKDSANAYNTFYNIAFDFDLNSEQVDEYDLYEDLIDLQWQMMNDTVSPDSTAIETLFDIEQYDRTTPGVFARNILISLGELDYQEPVYVPDFNKSAPINLPFWPEEVHEENLMKLFPNPAGIYFIVEHDLREYDGEITMQVISISGIVIESVALQNKQNQTVITTRNYPSGIYIVQLLVDGMMIEADKITIVR
ncbi:MAG: hypothetical protein DRI89_01695 [Bacteroidetes bacterium]|nr:MAG: hypothetical protein DRI89_01695 [Bacteroidota bacterium]